MKLTKIATMTLAAAFCAASLVGSPISARDSPSGTGKTLGATIVAMDMDAGTQDAGNVIDPSGADAQDQQANASDMEWKYVPVRRTSG